jgi:hypothetical protein
MSERRRAGVGAAFRVIAEALDDPAGRAKFTRGLMLGSLVGAALAGSVLRARRAARARSHPARPPSVDLGSAPEGAETPGPATPGTTEVARP